MGTPEPRPALPPGRGHHHHRQAPQRAHRGGEPALYPPHRPLCKPGEGGEGMHPFPAFPTRPPPPPLPDPLFTLLLPQMEDLAEAKVLFYSFWLLARKGRHYLSLGELQADRNLKGGGEEGIAGALERAAERGVLLPLSRDGRTLSFLNSPQGREARAGMERGTLPPEEKTNIFDLYEQNIGVITP